MSAFRLSPLALGLALALPLSAGADDLFTATYTCIGCANPDPVTVGYSDAESAVGMDLDAVFADYNGTQGASADIDFRGVPMSIDYVMDATSIRFSIPDAGVVDKTFDGGSRDASADLLWDYLKKEGLSLMSKALAAKSPNDPVAGNPSSLMSTMMTNEFDQGFTSGVSEIEPGSGEGQAAGNLVGIGLTYGTIKSSGIETQSVTVPFSYAIRNNIDPRRQFALRIPLAFSDTEGAKSVQLGVGLSYSLPITDRWILTPAINYSATSSIDLGGVGQFASGSLTSSFIIPLASGRKLAIGNMIGLYKTLPFELDDLEYDPDIESTVFRNGIMLSAPVKFGTKKLAVEYSLIDNRFSGAELYLDNYQEIGVTIGTRKSYRDPNSFMRAGLNYLYSEKSKGVTLNFGYWF